MFLIVLFLSLIISSSSFALEAGFGTSVSLEKFEPALYKVSHEGHFRCLAELGNYKLNSDEQRAKGKLRIIEVGKQPYTVSTHKTFFINTKFNFSIKPLNEEEAVKQILCVEDKNNITAETSKMYSYKNDNGLHRGILQILVPGEPVSLSFEGHNQSADPLNLYYRAQCYYFLDDNDDDSYTGSLYTEYHQLNSGKTIHKTFSIDKKNQLIDFGQIRCSGKYQCEDSMETYMINLDTKVRFIYCHVTIDSNKV